MCGVSHAPPPRLTPAAPPLQIVSVHIPTQKVTEILFPPALIEILMVDPISDDLLSWSASTTYAALLQKLNATTGKASSILTASLDLSGNGGKLLARRG